MFFSDSFANNFLKVILKVSSKIFWLKSRHTIRPVLAGTGPV